MKSTPFKHIIITLTLSVALLSSFTKAVAQSYNVLVNKNYTVEAQINYGFFMHHHLEMSRFKAHFPSYQLSLQRNTFGKHRWETLYHYPTIGLSFLYSGLGGFEEIGQVYALYPFINFPLNKNQNSQITFKLGVGLAYLTNKFDRIENYQNFSIGSHFNAAVNLTFEYRQKVSDRIQVTASAGLVHFSNGSTKTPNFGLNIFNTGLGMSYYIKKPNPKINKKLLPELYPFEFDGKKWFSVDFQFAVGVKDLSQEYITSELYTVYDLSANVLKQFSNRSKAGIAFELVLDNSDKAILASNHKPWEHKYELLKPGIGAAYELLLDRMSFLFNLGWHLAGADQSEGSFYQKLTLRYECFDNIYTIFSLTTHYARADYLGLGIGYRFDFKYYTKRNAKKYNYHHYQ